MRVLDRRGVGAGRLHTKCLTAAANRCPRPIAPCLRRFVRVETMRRAPLTAPQKTCCGNVLIARECRLLAFGVMMSPPVLLPYLFSRRWFIQSVVNSAAKG